MINEKVKILKTEIISDSWYTFKKVHFSLKVKGSWDEQTREVFDRGNGATILLYNQKKKSVILTNQFRIPTFLNGNVTGMMIEACAGTIEEGTPEENIIRETEEETGFHIKNPVKIYEAYMSPGAVTEVIHFFIAEYDDEMKMSDGGGKIDEHEHIEVLEIDFAYAMEMIGDGSIKDAKTIMLLQYLKMNHHLMN